MRQGSEQKLWLNYCRQCGKDVNWNHGYTTGVMAILLWSLWQGSEMELRLYYCGQCGKDVKWSHGCATVVNAASL